MDVSWIFRIFFICISTIFCKSLTIQKEYDYVIVGAGSAGATVASRLAEDSRFSVLLLEAGTEPLPNTEVPYLVMTLQNTSQDWAYFTEPQDRACQGMENKKSYWPRGKALGGSSTLNFMMYVRGNRRDYDGWAAMGCPGWSYDEILPYFKKTEDCRIPELANNGFHGVGGNLTVSYPSFATPLREMFLAAGKELGYDQVDHNGAQQTGVAINQGTIQDGARCSVEKAFLRQSRPNLHIVDKAFVLRVRFDEDKTARSVLFERDGSTYAVAATMEIIISAGAINSPQLLMLSGVGPKQHLEELGIPVVADIPGVGQNLQDHIGVSGLNYRLNKPITLFPPRVVTEEAFQLFQGGKGPLTVPGAVENTAFIKTKFADPEDDYPDIQIIEVSTAVPFPYFDPKLMEKYSIIFQHEIITMGPLILRPKSRGFIKLRSSDPHQHPIIDPRYLSEDIDLQILKDGIRITHEMSKTEAFQLYEAEILPEVMPGCEDYEIWTDDYYACLARTLTITIYHPSGTCKMGDPDDPTTVVDSQLRVKGVKRLRVADASIMPTVPSGNTNAPCIMIGEKLADMIKND